MSFRLRYTPSQEVADYWRERGISIALCGQVLKVIELLERGVLESRTSRPDERPIHGKVYVTDRVHCHRLQQLRLLAASAASTKRMSAWCPLHGELFEGGRPAWRTIVGEATGQTSPGSCSTC